MRSGLMAACAATTMLACTAAADAATVALSYQYSGTITTYPVDDGAAGSPNTTSGSGSMTFKVADLSSPFELSISSADGSGIDFQSPSFSGDKVFAAIFGSGPIAFEGDVFANPSSIFTTYSFSFSAPSGFYSLSLPGGGVFASVDDGFTKDSTGSISGSFTLTLVPLPAAAPMFGAALLALGAIGCGVNRKKIASA